MVLACLLWFSLCRFLIVHLKDKFIVPHCQHHIWSVGAGLLIIRVKYQSCLPDVTDRKTMLNHRQRRISVGFCMYLVIVM